MFTTSHDKLAPFELRKLAGLLHAGCTVAECHGLLSAVVVAPSMLPPSVWFPQLVTDSPVFAEPAQAQESMGLLMRFYNSVAQALREEGFVPYGYPDAESTAEWCRGFLRGSRLDQRWWKDEVGASYLLPVAVLAGEFDLTGEKDAAGNIIEDATAHITQYREALPSLVEGIYDYWASKRGKAVVKAPVAAAAEVPSTPVETRRKVGPNAPCPCGSGNKHKKCCGRPQASTV